MKVKELYRSKLHISSKSHDVIIIQESKVQGVKLKMTYECYNGIERFTGELFIGGKWEHFFSMLDLGIIPDTSMYVCDETKRENRSTNLFQIGVEFFNKIVS